MGAKRKKLVITLLNYTQIFASFPDSESVNEALRFLIRITKNHRRN